MFRNFGPDAYLLLFWGYHQYDYKIKELTFHGKFIVSEYSTWWSYFFLVSKKEIWLAGGKGPMLSLLKETSKSI